ncbi:MAG: cation efflux family transporter [Betaproteobacteria bacterium RIFCSPLOWO2_02_64_14]|nr:MAG: cation efflux family transporter [Betaproteobacteria bacterium RIFCSPLOWO2_02_64_14]
MAGQGKGAVRAILYALAANAGIAAAKGGAAFWTGSGAMLAETIHSVADCANQVLLLIGLKRSQRPATADHPLGYGRATYFWSMIVALMLFSVGGLYAVYEGIERLMHPAPIRDPWLAVGILAFSVALEAGSLWGALKIIHEQRGSRTFWEWFRATRQSELMVVAGEDIAALLGLVFALIAVIVAIVTGNPLFDALGSLAIGTLLIVVAFAVMREVKGMIVGESADPLVHAEIERFVAVRPEVDAVLNLITLQWGERVVVAAKVRMRESSDAARLVEHINACEVALKQRFPQVAWIFFEPDVVT